MLLTFGVLHFTIRPQSPRLSRVHVRQPVQMCAAPCREINPVHHAALAIIPPMPVASGFSDEAHVWNRVQELRSEWKDPGLWRWPPHINLMYPCPDPNRPIEQPGELEASAGWLETALSDAIFNARLKPFKVRLAKCDTFKTGSGGVVWLDPVVIEEDGLDEESAKMHSQGNPWQQLIRCVSSAVGTDNERWIRKPFIPHMTVTHTSLHQDALDLAASHNENAGVQGHSLGEFWVRDMVLLIRSNHPESQFEHYATISLLTMDENSEAPTVKIQQGRKRLHAMPEHRDQVGEWLQDAIAKRRSNRRKPRRRRRRASETA
ncbi:hypothetical protein FVE85_1895 [Porphyridium purpureum]|uniref:Cyclic phosphodiesterase n=1 Tax=Porphyridium purpureum TaxID=35688 RepID=A0A5J4YXR2_PORPP|nr:hypothetical protein FVE85_1895 [Porphyridium purpureum]|eukprot:POR0546..scf209_3